MFTKEDYVSLETAKMLKEKGFDMDCLAFYKDGKLRLVRSEWEGDNIDTLALQSRRLRLDRDNKVDALAPTLYEAQKWLIKRYSIYVCPTPYLFKDSEECAWFIVGIYRKDETNWECFADADGEYISYEQALDAGIRGALELIKED